MISAEAVATPTPPAPTMPTANPAIPDLLVRGFREDLRFASQLELLAEVSQSVSRHRCRSDRAGSRTAAEPEHGGELSEITAGVDVGEVLFGGVLPNAGGFGSGPATL